MTDMQNVSKPMFEVSTDCKIPLGHYCDYINNTITAFFAYMTGDKCIITYDSLSKSLGIEKYKFTTPEYCAAYHHLLKALNNYAYCLTEKVSENSDLFDYLESTIGAFNTKYDGHFDEKTWRIKRRANRILEPIPSQDIKIDAFDKYTPLTTSQNQEDLISIDNCEPVFKTTMIEEASLAHRYYYVYQIKLVKSGDNKYSPFPCVHIALFKDANDAKMYNEYYVNESRKFRKNPNYKDLIKNCGPAAMRWYNYTYAIKRSTKTKTSR